jgi:hypothetical protein
MSDDEMLKHYSAALDEIYRLRVAAAYEARILENALDYATLPKRVRSRLADAGARLDASACGRDAYGFVTTEQRQTVLNLCRAPLTLTRHEWENRPHV